MNVRILGRKLCAESVRSKKYDKHVEHSIAAGQYRNTSMPSVNRAGGCKNNGIIQSNSLSCIQQLRSTVNYFYKLPHLSK